jgi:hypothetical protein
MRRARRGDLEGAWAMSDRIRSRHPSPDWHAPRHLQRVWDGTPLAGRHVLVRCYHGLGDTIQFIRYATLVAGCAREVSVWAQPALLSLVSGVAGVARALPLHDGVPEIDYDVDVEIMELPYVFRTTLDTVPHSVPYLAVDAAALPGAPPRIGVVWRAGAWDRSRSVPFQLMSPLFDLPGITWFSLQHDAVAGERHRALGQPDVNGLDRTAALMRALDLVVTIDSVSAHLAGALAVPVWTLLPEPADWRWMIGRDDSPWYPTMRLFRQRRTGDWGPVIDAVRAALGGIAHATAG